MKKLKKKNRRLLRNERALAHAVRVFKLQRHSFYSYISGYLTYRKLLPDHDYETIEVNTHEEYEQYYQWLAKVSRDNLKSCSCVHCGNPRKKVYDQNNWRARTRAENKAYVSFVQQMDDLDMGVPHFRWRAWKMKQPH